ncbi:MAG: DUF975 family protein [Eubacteriales bacterium]|nr:DUF975 family protein [Eubacteriales bacterium]
MLSNKELRQNARNQLDNQLFGNKWMIMLVICLIPTLVDGLLAATLYVSFLSILVFGPFCYAVCKASYRLVKGEENKIVNAFDGFTDDFGKSFVLGLLNTLFVFLWGLLLVVPGIIMSYAYSMAFYLQQDGRYKDLTAKQLLDKSREIMNGYKAQLFLLDLSFIGWYIVGALCLGVGTLWVNAYHQVARANFYKELIDMIDPVVEGEEDGEVIDADPFKEETSESKTFDDPFVG